MYKILCFCQFLYSYDNVRLILILSIHFIRGFCCCPFLSFNLISFRIQFHTKRMKAKLYPLCIALHCILCSSIFIYKIRFCSKFIQLFWSNETTTTTKIIFAINEWKYAITKHKLFRLLNLRFCEHNMNETSWQKNTTEYRLTKSGNKIIKKILIR